MNDHETIRKMLASAAAGSLETHEQILVEQHARDCGACRRELEVLGVYARSLGALPQPVAPAGLVERTHARLVQQNAAAKDKRQGDLMLGLLAAFSWVTGTMVWIALRALVRGDRHLLQLNLIETAAWSFAFTILAWATAGVAAILISKQQEWVRREL